MNPRSEYFPSLPLALSHALEWMLGCRPDDRGGERTSTMSAYIDSNPDLAALRDDLTMLKRDVTGLVEHLKSGAANGVQNAADILDDGARRFGRNVAAEGEHSAKALRRQIEAQPLAALLIALGVGYIGGRVLSR
jgi:hypothetical protein